MKFLAILGPHFYPLRQREAMIVAQFNLEYIDHVIGQALETLASLVKIDLLSQIPEVSRPFDLVFPELLK